MTQNVGNDEGVAVEHVRAGEARHPASGSLIAVFVAAACMRSAITALGPLLHLIRDDTGLSDTELGLLSSLPLLGFAGISPLLHGPSRRFGFERLVTLGLVVLVVGTVVRSLPALAPLWIGTALIGGGVAVCNVVLPSVVKRDFADRITLVTGGYSAVMGTFAALASGIALPVANVIGDGWRWSLGMWAIPSALGAAIWAYRARTHRDFAPITTRTHTSRPRRLAIAVGLEHHDLHGAAVDDVLRLRLLAAGHRDEPSHLERRRGWYLFGYQVCGLLAGLGDACCDASARCPSRRDHLQPAGRHRGARPAGRAGCDRAVGRARRCGVRDDVGRRALADEPRGTRSGLGRRNCPAWPSPSATSSPPAAPSPPVGCTTRPDRGTRC